VTTIAQRLHGRSELGLAALLGVVGGVVVWDASRLQKTYAQADVVGPRTLPFIVGGLLLLCAVLLAADVLRGGQGEAEGGEDIDLTHPTEWRVVVPLIGFFVANILLVERLGWVISGAILFWGCAWTLGSRHAVRDALVSVAVALASFYLFYAGLGIHLPAGVLEGVL
jgi:putative tricarboxylic transport membrane protein